MCGIAGIIRHKPSSDTENYVSKMTSMLIHRGPDDEGVWCEGQVGLGHRRLSIIDLSISGAQPMTSHCNRYVLVYNGEIYNHLELRRILETKGIPPKWRGHSDTETLLEAISHFGIDEALSISQGMFALALWDKKRKLLFLHATELEKSRFIGVGQEEI